MKVKIMRTALTLVFLIALAPLPAMAWRGHHHGFVSGWSRGYWFHGTYMNHIGWWWIVGPTWYYYPEPVYPYPSESEAPVYFVEVQGTPPPVAPPPPTNVPPTSKQQAMSYYCEKSKNYYPLVSTCDGPWVATPVKPPGP